MAPDYKIPYAANTSVGITREHRRWLSLRADYVHTQHTGPEHRARHELDPERERHVRPPRPALREHHARRRTAGFIKYDGLLSAGGVPGLGALARAGLSYTLSKTTSNMSTGLSTGGVTNPFDLDEDRGPDDNDRRHNLVVDGSYVIPKVDVQAGRHRQLSQCSCPTA